MSNRREHLLSPLEKVDGFLQLDEKELSSMSSAELQEELTYMGANIPKLKAQIINIISDAIETKVVDDSAAVPETTLPDWFGMDMTVPTLGDQMSVYLSSAAALSEATNDQFQLKELPLISFFRAAADDK